MRLLLCVGSERIIIKTEKLSAIAQKLLSAVTNEGEGVMWRSTLARVEAEGMH